MDFPENDNASEVELETAAVVVEPVAEVVAAAPVAKEKEKEAEPEVDKDGLKAALPWYAVHTYAGFEGRVKLSLEERIRSESLQEKFGNVLVPQETVVELLKGQKKTSSRKLFPSYILVQLKLDEDTWHVI